jgi:transcriptional regulator GlxA family with amidase domain
MRIAIALFDGAEELDFAGPWEVLAYWAHEVAHGEVEVVTVASSLDPIRAAKGLRVLPDHALHEAGAVDVFLMPGGRGTRQLLRPDEPLHVALRSMAERGTLMTSVCTGSLVYAAAGLLRNRPATTYWAAFDELLALDESIEPRRAAGVSAGIDMALHLVARLDGVEAAKATRRGIQYDPEPPV